MNAVMSQKLPKCIVLQVSCEGRSVVTERAPSCQVSGTLCPSSTGSVTQTERKESAAGHSHTNNSLLLMTKSLQADLTLSQCLKTQQTSHPEIRNVFLFAWQLAALLLAKLLDDVLHTHTHTSALQPMLCCITHTHECSVQPMLRSFAVWAQVISPEDSLEPRSTVHCTLHP